MANNNSNQWDDQELHQLFAQRLPVLSMPDDFLERLTSSVLDEVVRHVEQRDQHRVNQYVPPMPSPDCESTESDGAFTTADRRPRCKVIKRRVPPL